jgi:hypothetical protein
MEIWTARQIGESSGAYSGREVEVVIRDQPVRGHLVRSDWPGSAVTPLIIDGVRYVLANNTPVTVF